MTDCQLLRARIPKLQNAIICPMSQAVCNIYCLQGWWDQHWLGCPSLDTVHNESTYMESISTVMALHTRYPGHDGHTGPAGSQLDRTIKLIDNIFDKCQTRACIHQMSIPLADYLYFDDFSTYQGHKHAVTHFT